MRRGSCPSLIEVPEASVRKVAIERGKERLVFERRGTGMGRWQMVEPKDVAAEPTRLETLVRNLKELRRSLDSGSIAGPGGYVWPRSAGRDGQPLGRVAQRGEQARRADRDAGARQDGAGHALRSSRGH